MWHLQSCQRAQFPLGLPHLTGTLAQHVRQANSIYALALQVLAVAHKRHILVSIENPSRSWLWSALAELARSNPMQATALSALVKTSFHACMYGSHRRKSTALLASPGLFEHMLQCDGTRCNSAWRLVSSGTCHIPFRRHSSTWFMEFRLGPDLWCLNSPMCS